MQRHDDLDNYTVDFDDDDPFASPPPGAGKKRKEPDDAGLGIDKEVAVQKRARVPNVKLDDERLLGPMGIPKLKARAEGLKLKGKGHEASGHPSHPWSAVFIKFSDAARLLSFYQLWLDDLFPKARFLDALSMVEKAGHKKKLQAARQEWLSQGKPRDDDDDDDNDDNDNDDGGNHNNPDHHDDGGGENNTSGHHDNNDDNVLDGHVHAPVRSAREMTPARDVPDDEDLYDATPRASRTMLPAAAARHDAPDEDDLEALMAEAEILDAPRDRSSAEKPNPAAPADAPDEDEDLDALIAEAEALDRDRGRSGGQQGGDGPPGGLDEYADDEDAMREMEGW